MRETNLPIGPRELVPWIAYCARLSVNAARAIICPAARDHVRNIWFLTCAVKGGRVLADWPGIKNSDLCEGRDLKRITDLRAVLKGALREHLRADEKQLAADLFPGSTSIRPAGLV